MTILTPIILLNLGAFALSRLAKVESTIAYLIVLMFSLDFIYFGALVDKLKPATAFCFAGMLGLFAVYIIKSKGRTILSDLKKYCNVHTVLNTVSSLLYFKVLEIKQPKLYYWDEIRIWGATAKSVKLFDRLYSIGVTPGAYDRNYPAGNALLNYLFSFFTDNFSEIMLLTSYAILFFAVFSAASKLVETKTKNRALSIGVYFALVLMPFLQNSHFIDTTGYSSISYAYGTSMVDFNVAVVFLAILVLYFFKMNRFWYLLPSIYLVTVKKNGIFMVLLAFCIIFCFEFFIGKFNKKKIIKLVATVMAGLIIPVSAYMVWDSHLDHYKEATVKSGYSLKRTEVSQEITVKPLSLTNNLVKTSNSSSKISKIISKLQSERYKEIMEEMKVYFSEFSELVYIKDKHLIVLLFLAGIVAAVLADKKFRLPLIFTSVGCTVACFVYNMCIAYQMQFYNDQMVEYPRYMLSYYFGWVYLMLIIVLVFINNKLILKKLLVFALLVLSLKHIDNISPERTILDATDAPYYSYMQIEQRLRTVNEILQKEDRVLLVWMDGYDNIFYEHIYYMLPAYCNKDTNNTGIDFSINFRDPNVYLGDKDYFNFATEEEFRNILLDYFDYVYICNEYDWDFVLSYGSLFDTEITRNSLYKVTDNEIPLQKVVYYEDII